MIFFSLSGFISHAKEISESKQKSELCLTLSQSFEATSSALQLRDLLVSSTRSRIEPSEITLYDTPLGIAPPLGKTLVIRRSDLDQILRRQHPKETWTWNGAEECLVTRPAEQIAATPLIELIEKALKTFVNKEGQLHVLQILNYSEIQIPKQAIMEVELVSPNLSSSFETALITVDYQGRPFLRRNIRFEWEWKRPVWVARQSHSTGRIQPDFFTTEIRNVLSLSGEPFLAESLPENLMIERSLAKGEPLLRSNLKTSLAVSSGSAVSACINDGALHVSMKAVALENGILGQTIRLKNPESGKELYGKITHENVVEVLP